MPGVIDHQVARGKVDAAVLLIEEGTAAEHQETKTTLGCWRTSCGVRSMTWALPSMSAAGQLA
jgi:hypothetical protein